MFIKVNVHINWAQIENFSEMLGFEVELCEYRHSSSMLAYSNWQSWGWIHVSVGTVLTMQTRGTEVGVPAAQKSQAVTAAHVSNRSLEAGRDRSTHTHAHVHTCMHKRGHILYTHTKNWNYILNKLLPLKVARNQ